MSRVLLLSVLLLTFTSATYSTGKDANIDAGPISHWQQTWCAAPIEVTTSNASESGVTLTFNIRITTPLSVGNIVEIHFPPSFTNGNDPAIYYLTLAKSAGSEFSVPVALTGSTPSSSGAYGPFKIYTRKSEEGQILDMTNSFGSVYFHGSISTDRNLDISAVVSGSEVPIATSVSLQFTLSITNDVWEHDVFVIEIDNDWTLESTSNTGRCKSKVSSGQTNYLQSANTTTSGLENDLECAADPSNRKMYIYGVANEIDVHLTEINGSFSVNFVISGIKSPDRDYTSTNYTWKVYHYRTLTSVLIKEWEDTGVNTSAGVLGISWKPHNGYSIDKIVQGMILYMDITLTTAHTLPDNGDIVLTFSSGIDISTPEYKFGNADQATSGTANYCHVAKNDTYDTTCTIDSATGLTINADTAAGVTTLPITTTFIVSVLAHFTGASPSVSAVSKDSASVEIDKTGSNAATVTYASSSNVVYSTEYQILFTDQLNTTADTPNHTTGTTTGVIVVDYKLANSVPSGNITITIHGPWQSSTSSTKYDNNLWLDSTSGRFDVVHTASNSIDATSVDLAAGTAIDASSTSASGSSLGQIAATYDQNSLQGGALGFYNTTDGTTFTANIALPKVASNLYTRYETWMSAKIASNALEYNRFAQIAFAANDLTTVTLARICENQLQLNMQTKFDSTQASGQTYYIDIEFNSTYGDDLGSNLSIGNTYPAQLTGFASGASVVLQASNTLRITGQTDMDSTVNDYVIKTSATNTNNLVTVTWFYMLSGTAEKHVFCTENSGSPASGTAADGDNITQTDHIPVNSTGQPFTSVNLVNTGTYTYYMQFPVGFDVSSASIGLTSNGSTQTVVAGTSGTLTHATNRFWAYPTIFGDFACGTTDCILLVTGVQVAPYQMTAFKVTVGHSANCVSDNDLNLTGGDITVGASGSNVESRGPDSYHADISITLTPATGIPGPVAGHTASAGTITAALNSNWLKCPSTTCSISGLTATDSSSAICAIDNNGTITLSNFNAHNAGTQITISLTDIMPPENTSGSSTNVQVVSSASTSYSTTSEASNTLTGTIDTASSPGTPTIAVATRQTRTTTSTVKQLTTIPNNVSAEDVDLYFRFSLSKSVPSGTVLTITSPVSWTLPTSNLKDYVFFSIEYETVTRNSNDLVITLKQDVSSGTDLELYVEEALNNPTADTTTGFKIKTQYTCGSSTTITLDDDSALPSGTAHNLQVTAGSGNSLGTATITQNVNNAGESSDYTFTFTTDSTVESTDYFLIKFPRVYDEYVSGFWPTEEFVRYKSLKSSYYYVSCESQSLGSDVECTVDHRMVKVFNVNSLDSSQSISITIFSVKNPQESSTNTTFKIYQMDTAGSIKAKNENASGPTIGSLAENIKIQSLTVQNHSTFGTGDYVFKLFLPSIQIISDNTLDVILPRQYNTDLARGQSNSQTTPCTIIYYNVSDTTSEFTTNANNGESISGLSTCSVSDNEVSADFDSGNSTTFDDSQRIDFSIDNLNNPQWGLARSDTTDATANYDAWDDTVFTLYKQWTYQLRVGLYNSNANEKKYQALSYENVNVSYLGFSPKYRGFTVNSFNPINRSGIIVVQRGTQSQHQVIQTARGASDPLGAKQVKLAASLNGFHLSEGSLTITSVYHDFTIFDTEYQIPFRVGASASSDLGVYYINWTVTEVSYEGSNTTAYDPPVKTLVEVNNANQQVVISVTPNSQVRAEIGRTTIPIAVHTNNPPVNDLTVNLALNEDIPSGQVTLSSSTLNFGPEIETRYFTITVDSNYDTSANTTSGTVTFTLSGTNQSSYIPISNLTFTIQSQSTFDTVSAPSLSLSDPNRTSITVQATSAELGVFYTYCGPQNDNQPSGAEIESQLGDTEFYLNTSTISTDGWKRDDLEVEPTSTDTASYASDWAVFQYRLLKQHLQQGWASAIVNYDNSAKTVMTLDELWAGLTYTCYSYTKKYDQWSEATSSTFTTDPPHNPASFEITFSGEVSTGELNDFGEYVAFVTGINPDRFLNGESTQTRGTSNEVTQTIFKWDIPPVLYREGPGPNDQLGLDDDQNKSLKALISGKAITLTPSFNPDNIDSTDYTTPQWTNGGFPTLSGNPTENSITSTMTCNTVGFICGICVVPQSGKYPNHYQILAGVNLDNNTTSVYHTCIDNPTANTQVSVSITGLTASTSYQCYYQCFNDYPVNPNYVAYSVSSDNTIRSISTSTTSPDDDDDFAGTLKVILFALLALLVQ